jgi:cold shock CspA family protein
MFYQGLVRFGPRAPIGSFLRSIGITAPLVGERKRKGPEMHIATVKFYDEHKRFGFAKGDDAVDYFMGGREMEKAGFRFPIEAGLRISFVPRPGKNGRGPEATEIKAAFGDAQ